MSLLNSSYTRYISLFCTTPITLGQALAHTVFMQGGQPEESSWVPLLPSDLPKLAMEAELPPAALGLRG